MSRRIRPTFNPEPCGCWYFRPASADDNDDVLRRKRYLPQVDVRAHASILSYTARTTLTQTFVNPTSDVLQDVQYVFPLYDGVSVVAFRCEVGGRVIHGVVKERQEARKDYEEAVKGDRKAALLEQSLSAADVFTTAIGRVPAADKAVVHLTYLGQLKHDAQADGIRFSIPSAIAPRYGDVVPIHQSLLPGHVAGIINHGKVDVTVDVEMARESKIQTLQSPSHPVTMTLGRTSAVAEEEEDVFEPNFASATYATQDLEFGRDFVLLVRATGPDVPTALLETHPDLPEHRAIMTTLVPKFNIPASSPEIVFIIDRSGSMSDKIETLRSALRIFLKSLPVGIKFNICSFGSKYSFMWGKSQTYDAAALEESLIYVDGIGSDMGGTEMFKAVEATVKNRFKDIETDVLLLTDGQIGRPHSLFNFINEAVADQPIRVFSLGIGNAASHSLIEGIARAGDGFAQTVGTNEQLDKKVMRMLKGALTPHVKDYTLEIEYDGSDDDEYEIVEKSNDIPLSIPKSRTTDTTGDQDKMDVDVDQKEPTSLFESNYKESDIEKFSTTSAAKGELPELSPPKILQAPYKIPTLYSFNRTNVYLLLSPDTNPRRPKSVTLRGTSRNGPLTLTVPIEDVGRKATIHQLAARRLMLELEEGRGWVYHAKDTDGKTVVEAHESKKADLAKREAVRLGTKFQVSGQSCSFVAVEEDKEVGGEVRVEVAVEPAIASAPTLRKRQNPRHISAIESVAERGQRLDRLESVDPSAKSGFAAGVARRREGGGLLASVKAAKTSFGSKARQADEEEEEEEEEDSEPAGKSEENKVHAVIAQQGFEGWWAWTPKILRTIDMTDVDVESKIDWTRVLGGAADAPQIDKSETTVRRIMATLAAVAYLRVRQAADKETWELVADKAMAWVDGQLGSVGGRSLRASDGDDRMGLVEELFR